MLYCNKCGKWQPGNIPVCKVCGSELSELDFDDAATRSERIKKEKAETERIKQQKKEELENKKIESLVNKIVEEKEKTGSKAKGCGCLLMIIGVLLGITVIGGPLGGLLFVIGLVVLIVGFCI